MKKLLIAAAGSFILTAVYADADSRWYGVAGLGVASVHNDFSDTSTSSNAITTSQSVDTKGNVLLGGLGYQFNDRLAFEAQYLDMRGIGSTENVKYNNATINGQIWNGSIASSGELKATSYNFSAKYDFNLTNSSKFYGRLGVAQATVKSDQTISGSGTIGGTSLAVAQSASFEKTKTVPFFGLGYEYDLSKSLSLRSEFSRISTIGEKSTTGESAVNMITLQTKFKL